MRAIRTLVFLGSAVLAVQAAEVRSAFAQSATPSASIENVTIDAGFALYKIKRVDVFGSSMTAADLRQLFDPNDPKPLPDRLRALTADRIAIPEVVAELKAGQPGQSVTYRNFVLTGVNAGRIGDASAQGISMALTN